MKKLHPFTLGFCLFVSTVLTASAGFSSLYVFGDALSATTGNPNTSAYYNGRYSNGRVWIEVLAQRQGIPINYNSSSYDHNSVETLTDVNNFTAPADVASGLFIVWVCNADTFDTAQNLGNPSSTWNFNDNISAQANYLQIITTLYAKGVRTLILPNVVDLSEVPGFNGSSSYAPFVNTMHNGCVDYNARLVSTISQARASCPGLTIYTPDFFTLLNNVMTNAPYYGLYNALSGGFSIDALDDIYANTPVNLNGAGTNYIFWDPQDPTAKFHEIIADITQQIISPVQVGKITSLSGTNRLDIVNYPAGLDGFVDGITNLAPANWASVTNITSTNTTQSVFVPASGPKQFYRLRFPYAWSWP